MHGRAPALGQTLPTFAVAIPDILFRRMVQLCETAIRDGGDERKRGVRATHLKAFDWQPPTTSAAGAIVANMSAETDRLNVLC